MHLCVAVTAALGIGVSVSAAAAAELPSITATFSAGDNPNSIEYQVNDSKGYEGECRFCSVYSM